MQATPVPESLLRPAPANAPSRANPQIPRIDSRALLGGGHLLVIEHAGQSYYLRLTRNNKLILTK